MPEYLEPSALYPVYSLDLGFSPGLRNLEAQHTPEENLKTPRRIKPACEGKNERGIRGHEVRVCTASLRDTFAYPLTHYSAATQRVAGLSYVLRTSTRERNVRSFLACSHLQPGVLAAADARNAQNAGDDNGRESDSAPTDTGVYAPRMVSVGRRGRNRREDEGRCVSFSVFPRLCVPDSLLHRASGVIPISLRVHLHPIPRRRVRRGRTCVFVHTSCFRDNATSLHLPKCAVLTAWTPRAHPQEECARGEWFIGNRRPHIVQYIVRCSQMQSCAD